MDGETLDLNQDNWTGSQNHNWGSKHTDEYAWGQVCGFDNAADSFLELGTARVHIGPLKTPWFTPLTLLHEGQTFMWRTLRQALKNRGRYHPFSWEFSAENEEIILDGTIHCEPSDVVCLTYRNPPGGHKFCLNSKVSQCSLTLRNRATGAETHLHTRNRAAFEILYPTPAGLPVRV